jgi:ribose transport system ATP-binding protein
VAFAVYGLYKSYGGGPVLNGVDLKVENGEIHALLGANGAGKSTLIKCLSGATAPDDGVMIIDDEKFVVLTPKEARQAGVAVVYQELSLAASLNVSDNMFLGREMRRGPFVQKRAQQKEAARWLREIGTDIAPTANLASLSNAELQAVEIAKALRLKPKVLILDEPTAALSEEEARMLGLHLIALKKQNLPVLYVTHRLAEVFEIADRVTILRGGRVVLTGPVADFSRDALVNAIVGQEIEQRRPQVTDTTRADKEILKVDRLVAAGVGPLSFHVSKGEVVGVFGLVGSGRTELLEALFGARRTYGGRIELAGQPYSLGDPAAAVARGLALVPSDRLRKSILGPLTAGDNVLLPSYSPLGRLGFRRLGEESKVFDRAVGRLHLHPHRIDLESRRFSGGNQQKLVIARWLNSLQNCRLLLLDEPTQGVDVGARRDIYEALAEAARAGCSALVTSSEPEELVQIAHRVIVLSRGRIVSILSGEEINENRLLSFAHVLEQGHPAA